MTNYTEHEKRTPMELYEKLRPVLRTYNIDCGGSRRECKRQCPEGREPFYVKCSRNYCWGGFWAGLKWKPKTRPFTAPGDSFPCVGIPPTFEQFCTWYGLDAGVGLS